MATTIARRKRGGQGKLIYFALVQEFPLVSIKNEKQFWAAEKVMQRMLKLGKLGPGEQRYFDALCDLIQVYDDERFPIAPLSPEVTLAQLIEERGITQLSVSRGTGISPSIISEILKGKRTIALSHLAPLAKFFNMPKSVFLKDE